MSTKDYDIAARDLGEAVAYQLDRQIGVELHDLSLTESGVSEPMYDGEHVEVNFEYKMSGDDLDCVEVQSDEIPELVEPKLVTVDSETSVLHKHMSMLGVADEYTH